MPWHENTAVQGTLRGHTRDSPGLAKAHWATTMPLLRWEPVVPSAFPCCFVFFLFFFKGVDENQAVWVCLFVC